MKKLKKTKTDDRPRWLLFDDGSGASSGVSPSFMKDFMRCKETTRVAWVLGWRAAKFKIAPSFGTLGHSYLEHLHADKEAGVWKKNKLPTESDLENKYTQKVIDDFKERQGLIGSTYDEDLINMTSQLEVLIPAYCRFYPQDFSRKTTWVSSEQRFRVPFVYEDGKETTLTGFKDAIFKNEQGFGIQETKFKSRIETNNLQELLPFDVQCMLYAHCLLQENPEEDAVQIHYNVLRRPGLKQGKNEGLDAFISRIRKDVGSRPEHYFFRLEMPVTRVDAKAWENEFLKPLMAEIRWWWNEGNPKARSYTNTEELIGKYGPSDYFDILVRENFTMFNRKEIKPNVKTSGKEKPSSNKRKKAVVKKRIRRG